LRRISNLWILWQSFPSLSSVELQHDETQTMGLKGECTQPEGYLWYIAACITLCMRVCVCMHVYAYVGVCMCVCMSCGVVCCVFLGCGGVGVCLCVCVCMHACECVCVCVCVLIGSLSYI